MPIFIEPRALAATLAVVFSAAAISPVHADVKDYEFQLVEPAAKVGDGAVVAVRLIDKRTSKPVPNAVIIASRIDMAPGGMPTMTAPLEAAPSDEPGVYRFKTGLPPEKWSSLRYGFWPCGGLQNAEEEARTRRDRCEAAAG